MDVSQYLEIFIDESEEHLQTLSDCIMVLEKEPDNKDTINEVFRAAHSLKGMAGTMGFKRMQHLTHDMEDVFQEVRSDKIRVNSKMIDILFDCLDALDKYLENIKVDYSNLTGCADYKIPQTLRALGIIEYDYELSNIVDTKHELDISSKYEVEIRASQIVVINYIKSKLKEVKAIDINDYLFTYSKKVKNIVSPYHLCRNTNY